MRKRIACGTTVVVLILLLAACGHKSSPSAPSPFVAAAASAQSIQISGAGSASSLTVGESQQLGASAIMSDGSVKDVSSLVAWTSANEGVATVTSSGLVTGIAPGEASIRAAYENLSSGSTFTIIGRPLPPPGGGNGGGSGSGSGGGGSGNGGSGGGTGGSSGSNPGQTPVPTIQSITITGDRTLRVGRSAQFHAIADMSDGSEKDVSASCGWRTDNAIIGTISQHGVLTGLVVGSVVVTADCSGATASQSVSITLF